LWGGGGGVLQRGCTSYSYILAVVFLGLDARFRFI